MARSVDIAVIGGGIAGLAAAWTAQRAGRSVHVFEAGPVAGGKMRSERCDGYLIEHGPHSFLGSADTLWRLLAELEMTDAAVAARPPNWRYVYRGGVARRLPVGLGSAIGGNWLSMRGKLRALAEPWIAGAAAEDDDLLSFMTRRFGAELAEGLVAPFVTGIYAGDASALGARDAFPKLWQFEHEHGSIVRGAWAQRQATKAAGASRTTTRKRGLFSLRDGMATLPLAIAARLGDHLSVDAQVTELRRDGDRWTIQLAATDGAAPEPVSARRVIVATPPEAAHALLAPMSDSAAIPLARARTCPMVMVHIGGPTTADGPRGFGALVARGEDVRALGLLLPTSLFPGRAPEGHACSAVFFGGAQDPEVLDFSDDRLVALAVQARRNVFGLTAETEDAVTFQRVVRWPHAIVQYEVGHRSRMADAVAALARDTPGVLLAGAHLDGVSMSDAAASGIAAAEALLGALATSSADPAIRAQRLA